MSDIEKIDPGVIVNVGNQQRKLVYNNWSFLQLEKLTGKSILQKGVPYQSVTDLVTLLWAGLIATMPELDGFIGADGVADEKVKAGMKWVAQNSDLRKITELMPAIMQAINQTQPEVAAEKKA